MKAEILAIMDSIKPIKETKIFNNGYVQLFDFSKANSSEENRIAHVCHVANVCRGDKGVLKPEELYQKLLTEHGGKTSSVFEFIPYNISKTASGSDVKQFGTKDGFIYLSNLRAALEDRYNPNYHTVVDGFTVFKLKVPMMIVPHILRHRAFSFMQVSERTQKLREYFYCDEFKAVYPYKDEFTNERWSEYIYDLSQSDFDYIQRKYKVRQELTNKGSHGLTYVTLWIAAWRQNKYAWDNFFSVRCSNPAQKEMQTVANTIKQMIKE